MIYANIATKAKIVVIDRGTHRVTDWPLKTGKANYPMALDEADHCLFVVTRKPAQVVVLFMNDNSFSLRLIFRMGS